MAKYVLVTQDLNDEQKNAIVDVLQKTLPEVGWTFHKIVGEDVPDDRNGHILVLAFAEIGNPPKENNGG